MKFINLYNIIIESRLNDYKIQLKDDQLAQNIFNINNPKKQKMIIKWIKNGSIEYPKDIQIINKAYEIINRKQLDYNNYNSPQQILDQYQQLNQKIDYNPDNQKCFTNKVQLGNGVVVYNVQNSQKGRQAIRRAVDYNWGFDANPWCIIAKNSNGEWRGGFWYDYDAIPKRICFKDGQLIAMCANDKKKIKWWDRNDKPRSFRAITGVKDDPNAVEFVKKNRTIEDILYDKTSSSQQLLYIYKNFNISKTMLINLIIHPKCPIELLQKIGQDVQYLLYIFKNPNFKQSKKLTDLYHYYLASKDKNTNPQKLRQIYQKFKDDITLKEYIASNPNTPQDVLQKLIQNGYGVINVCIAKRKKCPIQLLQKLSNDKYQVVRQNVAKNPNTPKQILQKLSNDEYLIVRCCVARNPNTPPDILEKLSNEKHMNHELKYFIAQNPNCPLQILKRLSNDENFLVRSFVAKNPNFR